LLEINTKHAKKVFTDDGNAKKVDVVEAVNERYKKKFIFHASNATKTDDDICDAIAMAYTYIIDEREGLYDIKEKDDTKKPKRRKRTSK